MECSPDRPSGNRTANLTDLVTNRVVSDSKLLEGSKPMPSPVLRVVSGLLMIMLIAASLLALDGPVNAQELKASDLPFKDPVPSDLNLKGADLKPKAAEPKPKGAQIACPTPDQLRAMYKPIRDVVVKLDPPEGQLPIDCATGLFAAATPGESSDIGRGWADSEMNWAPTELAHQPLYFDDVPLERYGQSHAPLFQPLISGARFFGTLPVLPYKMGLDRPHARISTLGYYRPGSPAPCVDQTLPLDFQSAFVEGGAWVGLIFLLP